MKKLIAAVRRMLNRVPKRIRLEAKAVALAFLAAFVASARPALPALLHSPSFGAAGALLFATVAAAALIGLRAAAPLFGLYLTEETTRAAKHLHVNVRVLDQPEFQKALDDLGKRLYAEVEKELAKRASSPIAGDSIGKA